MNSFFDAFISYGRADSKSFASKLNSRLTKLGFNVWFDQTDIPPAVDWQHQIDDGIEHSHNFIFIIAPHSLKSPYCLKEIQQALKCNKRIIPLLHVAPTDCWDKMHPTISKINWIYCQDSIDDFEEAFTKLINSIQHQADYVEHHTKLLIKALEWERHHKQTNYLLIGSERIQAESWLKVRFVDEQPPCLPTDLHCEFIGESTKNANNLLTQVFISYCEQDKDIKEKVGKTLRREGFTVWTHETDLKTGIEFQKAINEGIEAADNIVYLLSTSSLQSKYCQQELKHSLAHNKRLITLLIETVDFQQIPPEISRLQFIDFTNHGNEERYRLSAAQLLKELNQDPRYYEEHKILLVKGLKWLRQNRNRSLLLQGHNLQYYQNWIKVNEQRSEHPPLPLHIEFIVASSNQAAELSQEVFISYSRTDSDFARKLNEALQTQGKTTWFDQESIPPGSDFQQEIYRGIESSDNFLFIISPSSTNSPYCYGEVEYAQKLNKRLLTVMYLEVATKDLHPLLAKVQWIDFRRYRGNFYANFSELIRTIDLDREHVRSHTKWSQRALEWELKDKSSDLLLRGSELSAAQTWLYEIEQHNKQPPVTLLQKAFIEASKERQTFYLRQEEQQKQRELEYQRTQRKTSRKLIFVAISAAIVTMGLSMFAGIVYRNDVINQIRALIASSETKLRSNQELEAWLTILKAGKELKKPFLQVFKPNQKLKNQVVNMLLKLVYIGKERNRLEGHHEAVESVSFSPDGQTIATASLDHTVKLWNRHGHLIRTLEGHQDAVMVVSFSPDSQTIATGSLDKTVKLWNLEGKLLKTLKGHTDGVVSISFSPINQASSQGFSQAIATAGYDRTVKVWTVDGQLQQTLSGHTGIVRVVRFSPDGQTIASADSDGIVRFWNRQGQLNATLDRQEGEISDISFSPDGQTLATVSSDLNQKLKLWNWRQGILKKTLHTYSDGVLSLSFSPNGKTIATAGKDGAIILQNLEGRQTTTLKKHQGRVNSISFSPDGNILASASNDNKVKIWQLNNSWLTVLRGHQASVYRKSLSEDSRLFSSVGDNRSAKTWKGNTPLLANTRENDQVKSWGWDSRVLPQLNFDAGEIIGVSFSPDGKIIATASSDNTVKLWSREGKLLNTSIEHYGLRGINFSPDGKIITTIGVEGTVKLWNRQGKEIATIEGNVSEVEAVSFSPQGQMIATASVEGTVKLWNFDGTLITTLIGIGHDTEIDNLSFSLDGNTLASESSDNIVILWNVENFTFDDLMVRGCNWIEDYLQTRATLEEENICINLE
ncbi:MAG: TIR domain-containing protein [Symploca sp. SIO2B6]|nr:TIR domain-containing protein [Symploca sp. SIO2B6]